MKKILGFVLVGVLMASVAAAVNDSATGSGDAGATILRKLTLDPDTSIGGEDIEFGDILRPTSGTHTCTLTPWNDTTTSCVGGTGGGEQSTGPADKTGNWILGGTAGETFTLCVPDNITITNANSPFNALAGGITTTADSNELDLAAGDPNSDCAVGEDGYTGTFEAGNNEQVSIGGSISVDSATPDGRYTGTYTLTLYYN